MEKKIKQRNPLEELLVSGKEAEILEYLKREYDSGEEIVTFEEQAPIGGKETKGTRS